MAARQDPFTDPQPLDANPFADPSVRDATSGHNLSYGASFESLDTPTQDKTSYGGESSSSNDMASRLEEISRREAALADRESKITQREDRVRRYGRNNWPFFYPLIFHSIEDEIPAQSQSTVLTLYRLWLFLLIILVVNLVGCILLLISGQEDGGKDLGAGIMYVPVIAITSFLLWYRPIYNAYMKEHALFYYLFFIFAGFHIAFSIYMFIGIPSTGSSGLINCIHAFATGSIVTGVVGVLATAGWGLEAAGVLFEYRSIYQHHNEKGHTFQQAKNEVAQHGLRAYFTRGSQV